MLGALAIMLPSFPLPATIDRTIRSQFGPLMAGLVLLSAGYILLCLSIPTILDWAPTGAEPPGMTTILGLDRRAVGLLIRYSGMCVGIGMCALAARSCYRLL